VIAITIAFSAFLSCSRASAQGNNSNGLVTQLKQRLTGNNLVIQKAGIVGVPRNQMIVRETTFLVEDGTVHPPHLLVGPDSRSLPAGEKVQVTDITVDMQKDKVVLRISECGSCNGTSEDASYQAFVAFQFPKGYLAGGADAGQVEDVISQLLTIDTGNGSAQPESPVPSAAQALTNDDVLKMVQAQLPDSVIVAKIKSSHCQFDTSPDALISLKQARGSETVLKAIAEAPPVDPPPARKPSAGCGEYQSCISAGREALASARWNDAIAAFQGASVLQPSNAEAWEGIGDAYLATGRMTEVPAMWDRALNAGGPIVFSVCHETVGCRKGTLRLEANRLSFTSSSGEKLFGVSPTEVVSAAVEPRHIYRAVELKLKIAGKSYNFYFVPFGVICRNQEAVDCPQDGIEQQQTAFDYISQTISKLGKGVPPSLPAETPNSANPNASKN
jgi:hypothetical protein